MAERKPNASARIPKVRIARPKNRPLQLRYTDATTKNEVRITTGTYDESEAERQQAELVARLTLGLDTNRKRVVRGPDMGFELFRDEYRRLHLATLRQRSREAAESRLDIAERIVKPKSLSDFAKPETLSTLQAELLAGAESRFKRKRSPHSVKTYMNNVVGCLNWAYMQGWIEHSPRVRKLKVSKLKAAKGRPIVAEEFERMLAKTSGEVGTDAAASWKYLLRGLWNSGLRLDEAMSMSWDIPGTIQPVWQRGRLPVLAIPADRQKNNTDESIPLLPWFESVLLETPEAERTGWAFNPVSLHGKRPNLKKSVLDRELIRPSTAWVGKVISRTGKAAKVIVTPGDPRKDKPPKYASAHDLRRSCAERMLDANIPPMVISRVLRHSSWETTRKHYAVGDVQKDAGVLRMYLGAETCS